MQHGRHLMPVQPSGYTKRQIQGIPAPCCTKQGPPHQHIVCAAAYKRMRQTMQRKPMQQLQQKQYREALMQEVKPAGEGQMVFNMAADTPSAQAAQEQQQQKAALNVKLQADIAGASEWQQLEHLIQVHGSQMNYLTVSQIVLKLGLLIRGGAGPVQLAAVPSSGHSSAPQCGPSGPAGAADQQGYSTIVDPAASRRLRQLLAQLVQLVAACSSWFAAEQYAQVSFGMAAAGHADTLFWAVLTASSERKLLSCSGAELALLLTGIAWSGSTPSPQWLNKSEVQLSKHWHATSVSDAAAILWAWGRFSHTPSKPLMGRVSQRLGEAMRRKRLGPHQLLQVLYFVARLSKHHPQMSWLNLWCISFQPYLAQVAPGVASDILLCLASLQYKPRPAFLQQLLQQLVPNTSVGSQVPLSPTLPSQATEQPQEQQVLQPQADGSDQVAVGQVAGHPGLGYRSLAEMLDPEDSQGVQEYGTFVAQELGQSSPAAQPASRQSKLQGNQPDEWLSAGDGMDDEEEESFLMDDEQEEEEEHQGSSRAAKTDTAQVGAGPAGDGGQEEGSFLVDEEGEGEGEESFLMDDDQDENVQRAVTTARTPASQAGALTATRSPPSGSLISHQLSSDSSSASSNRSTGFFVPVLVMQPVQGMVPDLVMCGPMSDPYYPPYRARPAAASRVPVGSAATAVQGTAQHSTPATSVQVSSQSSGMINNQLTARQQAASLSHSDATSALAAVQMRHFSRELKARHLGPVGWSIATLQAPMTQSFLDAYMEQVQACLPDMAAAAVVDVLYGLSSCCSCSPITAKETNAPPQSPTFVSSPLFSSLPPAEPQAQQALGTTASAMSGQAAAAGQSSQLVVSQELVLSLAGVVVSQAEALEPDALAQTVVSLARLQVQPGAEWLQQMLDACLPKLGSFSAWALPDLLVGLAALDAAPLMDEDWWNSFEGAALPLLSRCPASHVSRMAWGLAAANHRPSPAWLHELLVAALAQFKRMDDGELVSLIWSCARLRHRPGTRWLDAYAQELGSRLGAGLLTGQQLADMLWGLAAVGHTPTPDWLQQVEALLLNRLTAVDPTLRMSPEHLAVVLWAFSVWHHTPSTSALISLLAQPGVVVQATAVAE